MRKLIDIEANTLRKLKIIAAIKDTNVKNLVEKIVEDFIRLEEDERLKLLNEEEKEDLGLYLLMKDAENDQLVDEEKVMKILKAKQ